MKRVLLLLTICMLASGASSWASGLAIPEQGAAAMGMSAAMTARNEDLSALYYNPAGIDYVQGFEIMLGDTPIMPRHKYTPFSNKYSNVRDQWIRQDSDFFDPAETNSSVYLPPFFYAAWSMNRSIVLGIGVNTPFGLGTDWDTDWDGRYNSTFAEITLINVNPTVTWRPTDVFSIGAGVSYYRSSATIEKMIDTGLSLNPALRDNTNLDSEFALEGDGTGYGFNFGVLYKPADSKYQWGASFRSAFDIEYEGTAKFTHQQTNIVNTLTGVYISQGLDAATAAATAQGAYGMIAGSMPAEQDGSATLSMPWMLNLGIRDQMSEKLVMSADVDIVGWERYEELVIDFDDDLPKDKSVQDKDWVNSWVARLGASYDLSPSLVLRGGAMYDFNPVPAHTLDAQMPDSDRYGLSLGAGYRFGNVTLDASYMLLKFLDRNKFNGVGYPADQTGDDIIDQFDYPADDKYYPIGNGKYESIAHLASVSLSYHF